MGLIRSGSKTRLYATVKSLLGNRGLSIGTDLSYAPADAELGFGLDLGTTVFRLGNKLELVPLVGYEWIRGEDRVWVGIFVSL